MEPSINSNKTDSNIVLIGMPAVGKSTVGVLLAKRLGFGFVDTDLIIQAGEHSRLHQIINARGMQEFCELEAFYIRRLRVHQTVIATGGSVVYRSHAMEHLKNLGKIIFLDIKLTELKNRLVDIGKRGVVCAPGQTIDQLYEERRPLYLNCAPTIVSCTALRPEEVVERLISVIGENASFASTV
jgi:shikimate kinase